jgi:crotonobetainyl-CoA:carnitine CoA-transferase CaiB-like acyl-CoA transferase
MASRRDNAAACIAALDEVFAARTADEWCDALRDASGVWSLVQTAREAGHDPQARANGYVRDARSAEGATYLAVSSPVRFDGDDPGHAFAPAHGADTDAVLQELLGLTTDELTDLKVAGAVL